MPKQVMSALIQAMEIMRLFPHLCCDGQAIHRFQPAGGNLFEGSQSCGGCK
ncbi:MAG: hypothetical protein KatS3mg052_1430 [Candidatus Roseilinea sp.]|nr:MAG: hypothetical protein KatS3mg052_1430 [Candidatus Roseilinea sp.]